MDPAHYLKTWFATLLLLQLKTEEWKPCLSTVLEREQLFAVETLCESCILKCLRILYQEKERQLQLVLTISITQLMVSPMSPTTRAPTAVPFLSTTGTSP